jgi:aryl-alcohol dehydrogenase-like predicted oxidoreductase
MQYAVLGRTGIRVSRLAFGAGPVSGLMTGRGYRMQRSTVERAIQAGLNWFDTAAGYGNGSSEKNLGRVLRELPSAGTATVHIATKVRIHPERPQDIPAQIGQSVDGSLRRLRVRFLTLLQLHNGVTRKRGDEPDSISVGDVLGPRGVADAFRRLKQEGMIRFMGLTGTGCPESLREVIRSGAFDAIQLPFNILNPSAGQRMPDGFREQDYGCILEDCREQGLGVFAIRVFAGGALLGRPPGTHTLKTPYFPLDLYERDLRLAAELQRKNPNVPLPRQALHFALGHPAVHSAIIGFGAPEHVDAAVRDLAACAAAAAWPLSIGGSGIDNRTD